jgi:hypothetical protein
MYACSRARSMSRRAIQPDARVESHRHLSSIICPQIICPHVAQSRRMISRPRSCWIRWGCAQPALQPTPMSRRCAQDCRVITEDARQDGRYWPLSVVDQLGAVRIRMAFGRQETCEEWRDAILAAAASDKAGTPSTSAGGRTTPQQPVALSQGALTMHGLLLSQTVAVVAFMLIIYVHPSCSSA